MFLLFLEEESIKGTKYKVPGKAYRERITLLELFEMFPDEASATQWFEDTLWPEERCRGKCGSTRTRKAKHRIMPYWCADCRSYFSARTGTAIALSNVPLRKWAVAIYLCLTNLKSISSMKLSRDIGVSQKTAWFMLHWIHEAWNHPGNGHNFAGPVEADEAYFGGKRRYMSAAKRKALTGLGAVGKTAVAGLKDRSSNHVSARVVPNTKRETLSRFIVERVDPGARIYTE